MKTNEQIFYQIFSDLTNYGKIVSPRGLKVLEIENYNYELPPYCRFQNFKCRNLNLDYIKKEFIWYLKGEATDTSITEHASLWKKMVKEDGTINSNYGRYIFGEMNQFHNVANILFADKDSRKASIVILTSTHLKSGDYDTPCTYSINFRIRENKLNMTVRMRSQDAIFGMASDVPCFSFIHEMMYFTLKESYPKLEYGMYYHSADSFHVYERHFKMLDEIVNGSEYTEIECPKIKDADEVRKLRELDLEGSSYSFTKWLIKS